MVKALFKWTGVVLLLVLVFGLIAGAWGTWVLRSSLPWTEGTRAVAGLDGDAEIIRDEHGVPHLYAGNDDSLYFALGYAHAQDRFWQMSFNRRIIEGRLAEILGARALDTDVYMRALDLDGAAERSLAVQPDTVRRALAAYTRGVNALLNDPKFNAPPEFRLLRITPRPWREADSLGVLKLMGLSLSPNARQEFNRAKFRAILGEEKAAEILDPPALPNFVSLAAEDLGLDAGDTPTSDDPAENGAPDQLEALDGSPAEQSNNWVVAGRRSNSNAPLLANDPHLRASIPGIWYLAHIAFADRPAVGVTLPGIPAVILGRNDTAAWAFTNTGPDVQDLYVVSVNPDNPDEYATETGFEPFDIREETIPVRDADPVTLTFKRTRHGPVLPKDHVEFADLAAADQEVALAWTLLDDKDTSLATTIGLMRVTSYDQAVALGREFRGPMQNILYADRSGTIGYLAPGAVPIRSPDHDTGGRAPVDGTLARNDWQGTLPYDALPFVRDPASGMIVTANNQIVPERYPHAITNDWIATERSRRIAERLEARPRHDPDSFGAIQMDTVSIRARRLLPLLTRVPAADGPAREARLLLSNWDGAMDGDRPEPLIYTAWAGHLARLVTADDFGADFPATRGFRENFLHFVLSGDGADWCDVAESEPVETCTPLVSAALISALNDLSGAYGSDIASWRWDMAHHVRFPHQPLDAVPVLGRLFSRAVPMGGGVDTVNVAPFSVTTGATRFDSHFSASYRGIYDMADLDASRVMITTGQSGHILSRHYDDMLPLWRDGETIVIETNKAALLETGTRLLLVGDGT